MKDPGAENPRARAPLPGEPGPEGIARETGAIVPTADRGPFNGDVSILSRLRGLGRRGGTRRLKLATVSGGEWRLSVGCAKLGKNVNKNENKIGN